VHKYLGRRPLRRRIVALAAAYAIALSGLIASFGAGRAAAEAAGQPGEILCHSVAAGQPAPSTDQGNGKICVDACCVGCLMLMAALPPPPATAVAVPQSASRTIAPPALSDLAGARDTKSHRSRAPPLAA
jgi:hypothetical protein